MDIPLNVKVRCAGSACGKSVALVLDPTSERVTHVVVQEKHFPHTQWLVPVDQIVEATPEYIELGCTLAELAQKDPFVEPEFVPIASQPDASLVAMYAWPITTFQPMLEETMVPVEQVPPGELAIHPGARVYDTHGQHVGQVDEFRVDPASDQITHLVLREGHLWGQKDVTIPVTQIDRIEQDEVYLKLGRQDIAQLPAVPVRTG
ncbi:MAG: PRC-barrel domain-containing protein [Chloroflexi bacterium]|nr:PRC-barrel domain-containing protein [Chloroflexota bacterium]MBU1878438.1 PRC-barrel domain-containing protein [Chloroflexota bacterium]